MTDSYRIPLPKFSLGRIVMTESVSQTLSHHDRDANESALWDGGKLFSAYHDRKGVRFWIITEADRNTTTVLLPDDY